MDSFSKTQNRQQVADTLEQLQKQILREWESRSRQKVDAAKVQTHLALRDSLPQFLDRLVETLRSEDPNAKLKENTEVAREHGEDRATQPEYTLDQVVAEYHILRAVIIEHIDARGGTDTETRKIVHEFLDIGISKAAVRYIEVETHRQKLQTAEIQAAKVEAERASQAKSAFLANMSHEIRTPLGAIMGFVALIKESGFKQDAEVTSYLQIIERNSHHLLRIIDDILDLTKVESGKMIVETADFPFVQFLADFASVAGLRAREKRLVFEFKAGTLVPEIIHSDQARLRQILTNVVGNAIKFTEEGRVELAIEYRDHHLFISVTDTGKGISPEQRSFLFQAFAQADSSATRKFGGSGLGLILTKKLSQALGGDFRLKASELGKGSCFEVSIPVGLPETSKLVPVKSINIDPVTDVKINPGQVGLRDLEILLVEDSPDNQFLILKILGKTGAKVTIANHGAQALEVTLTQKFDVIIMDIQMPVMDGHDAVKALRKRGYTGAVIALTAHAMKEESDRATASGFSHFLTKPIDRASLIELLSSLHRPLNLLVR